MNGPDPWNLWVYPKIRKAFQTKKMISILCMSHPWKVEQLASNAVDPKNDNKQYLDLLGGNDSRIL